MDRKNFDFDVITLLLFLVIALYGWMNVYSVSSQGGVADIWAPETAHGRQLIWLGMALIAIVITAFLDYRLVINSSYILYGVSIFLLLLTLIIGKEVNGARSWLYIGGQSFQPSEFAKFATTLALARYISNLQFSMRRSRNILTALVIILVPALITILQNDTGSALVFSALFLVLFREGVSPLFPLFFVSVLGVCLLTLGISSQWIVWGIIVGLGALSYLLFFNKKGAVKSAIVHGIAVVVFLGLSFSTKLIVDRLPEHQQDRIMVLFDPWVDPLGSGYNVIQSKIAIGSGGFGGKGFLEGNYTRYKFVPKQETDFIFCTVGEEWGWLGTTLTLIMFFLFLWRVQFISENSKTHFARIYGYGVFSIFLFHIIVNVGMTIGLVPVIGIPLPLFSYGGSAIISFTLLTAVLINLYSHRVAILGAK